MGCTDPGVSHADLREKGAKFCQYCGKPLQSRTNNRPVETIIINDDDTITVTKSTSWKPNNKVRNTPTSYDDSENAETEATKLARIPRRPAPSPLIKKEPGLATAIPASSEAEKGPATRFFLEAAQISNTARDKSAKKNPPNHSSTQFYYFNITVCRTKWVINENDRLPIPIFVSKSLEILYNYEIAIRKGPISGIHDWWENHASVPFVRKAALDKAYPSVSFYKNLTASSFTDLDIAAETAQNVRTIWTKLNSTKSKPDGKEHRRIFVTYQDIETIPKQENEDSFELRTKEEPESADEKSVKIKVEKGLKRKATSPLERAIKRSNSTDSDSSLPSLETLFCTKKSTTSSPAPRTPAPRTPAPGTPAPGTPAPRTPTASPPPTSTLETALRTSPLELPLTGSNTKAIKSSNSTREQPPQRISSRATKAVPAPRYE